MIVTIHQPNYLPWVGFFHKMSLCDAFVFLDNVPFSKNSYQNRCKIKTDRGAQWLTVPVLTSGNFNQPTNEVRIDQRSRWNAKHWRTIQQNYRHAPHFEFLEKCIGPVYETDWELLSQLNIELITRIAGALQINTRLVSATDLDVAGERSDLLCSISKSLGASEYLSGPSGANYLDEQTFKEQGIRVSYHSFSPPTYPQLGSEFVSGLSVLDLLANCGPESRNVLETGERLMVSQETINVDR